MGSESSSWKSSGLCIGCSQHLQDIPAWASRARLCERCSPKRRVYMHFFFRAGVWVCNFLEPDVKTPVGPIRTVRSEEKLREIISRGNGIRSSEDRNMVDYGIRDGRGSAWLELTSEQHMLLKADRRKPPQPAR